MNHDGENADAAAYADMGFMGRGTCLGLSGKSDLEFWPATIITFVPTVVMVLEQVSSA